MRHGSETSEKVQQERDHQHKMQMGVNRRRKVVKIAIWTVVVVVIVLIGYFIVMSNKIDTDDLPVLGLTSISSIDHVMGNASAKILLIEYSDFQCPACRNIEPFVQRVIDNYSSEVALVYRHFPLKNIHANAVFAARAAEAAGLQGKFFEMHDVLFEKQEEWGKLTNPASTILGYATDLGLDVDKFSRDITSNAVKAKVEHDFNSGVRFQISQTPTFFINGRKITSTISYDVLVQEIENLRK